MLLLLLLVRQMLVLQMLLLVLQMLLQMLPLVLQSHFLPQIPPVMELPQVVLHVYMNV